MKIITLLFLQIIAIVVSCLIINRGIIEIDKCDIWLGSILLAFNFGSLVYHITEIKETLK